MKPSRIKWWIIGELFFLNIGAGIGALAEFHDHLAMSVVGSFTVILMLILILGHVDDLIKRIKLLEGAVDE